MATGNPRIEIPNDLDDWLDFAEFNLDFDDTQRQHKYKVCLTNEELFLVVAYILSRRNKKRKIPMVEAIRQVIYSSPAFKWNVDFFGNRFEKLPLSTIEKKVLKGLHENQTKMEFGE